MCTQDWVLCRLSWREVKELWKISSLTSKVYSVFLPCMAEEGEGRRYQPSWMLRPLPPLRQLPWCLEELSTAQFWISEHYCVVIISRV